MKLDEFDENGNSLDFDHGGRPRVFTDMVLAQIPIWIVDGWTIEAIAVHIGTSKASLLSTCSRLGISLGDAKRTQTEPTIAELVLHLPKQLSEKIESRAIDFSMSVEHLVIILLNQIARDDLFDAVLDFEDDT